MTIMKGGVMHVIYLIYSSISHAVYDHAYKHLRKFVWLAKFFFLSTLS